MPKKASASLFERRRQRLRKAYATAQAKKIKAAGQGKINIVGLEEGGLGWRVTNRTGEPVKLRFGNIALPDDPQAESKFRVSLKAIDQALKAVDGQKIGRGGKKPPAFRYLRSASKSGIARPARHRAGEEFRSIDAD
jgi:hypothetical protein